MSNEALARNPEYDGGEPEEYVVWEPQAGPQAALIACPVQEVFYGGARGGGKTDGSLGDWLDHQERYGAAASGMFVRRELTQLDEAMARAYEIYSQANASWKEQKKTWVFPGGARLKFRYLDKDEDAMAYQGHSYTRVYPEELTNWPDPGPIMKLLATVRSTKGVQCGFRATGNPGGPGHLWVKARYIDPAPLGYKILYDEFENPFTHKKLKIDRVFIPAKLTDNQLLILNDPLYVARLQQAGSKELVRAWLEGDWNAIIGAFFDEFSTRHIIPQQKLPGHLERYLCHDWGSASPGHVGWLAVSDGTIELKRTDGSTFMPPRGALIMYHEWYVAEEDGNGSWRGLKLPAEEVAQEIIKRCKYKEHQNNRNVADPSIFKEDGGPSIAERMWKNGVKFIGGDNSRIAGADQMRARLLGNPDGQPLIYFMDSCQHIIRTLPTLPHDERNPEDVDTDAEDHPYDSVRYGCMARPIVRRLQTRSQGPKYGTFDWLIKVTQQDQQKRSKYRP